MDRTEEVWSRLPVPIRVGLISAVSPDTKTEIRRFGSAPWDKLPEELRILLAPELVPDTDASDRAVHAGWVDGKPVYRASMAGHCIKELYLWRVGAGDEFDASLSDRDEYRDKGLLAAEEGNIHESLMVEQLRREGFEVEHAGDDQDQLEARYKRFVVRSHPDGLIRGLEIGSSWRVLECKALNEERFALWKSMGWEAFPRYAFQVSLEMFLASKKYDTQVLGFFVVKNRNTGQSVRALIDRPPVDPAVIINRFSAIENLVEQEGVIPPCDPNAEWFFCPFLGKGHCDAVKGKRGEEIQVVEDPALEAVCREFTTVKATLKELEAQKDGLRSLIAERLILGPALKVGDFILKYGQRTRRGFDAAAAKEFLQARGVDPAVFEKETSFMELRVTGGKTSDTAFED